MALTVSNISKGSDGSQRIIRGRIAFDSSYVTGGEALTARELGLSRFTRVNLQSEQGYVFETVYASVQPTSVNLKVFSGGGAAHTPSGTNAAITAGTPAGTLGTSAVTGTGTADAQVWTAGAYTPVGTNGTSAVTGTGTADAQAWTPGAYTPAGTLGTSAVTGTGTADAQVWTPGAYTPVGTNGTSAVTGTGTADAQVWSAGAYTPVGTNGTSAVTGTGTADAQVWTPGAYTPAGTNAVSTVTPAWAVDQGMIVKPVITLTHASDPVGGGTASALLYMTEGYGSSVNNCGHLESVTDSTTSTLGETANGTIGGVAASARFWVAYSAAPAGVQIYVNEASADQLEFISPTASDAYIIMPFEAAAGAPAGAMVKVKVHHSAGAAGGKALYFDDNGAADAQLIFVDAGTAGGVVPAADIEVLYAFGGAAAAAAVGTAAAQTFTGGAASLSGTNGTSSLSGLSLTAAAQTFTGGAASLTGTNGTSALSGLSLTAAAQTFTGGAASLTGTNAASALSGLSLTAAAQTFTGGAATLTGTNAASALSGLSLTAAAQTFTGGVATLTGTNGSSALSGLSLTAAAQTFTGSVLATHTHVFTGVAVGVTAAAEVAGAVDLSALSAVEFEAYGY